MDPDINRTWVEKMTTDQLIDEEFDLNQEISACQDRLSQVETELFYRQNPECKRSTEINISNHHDIK